MSVFNTNKSASAYSSNNRVKFIRGGKAYFDLLEKIIREAKEIIHLQVYIFDEDDTGRTIAGALKAAAQRNVRVYVMADGYASQSMSTSFVRQMTDSGINFRFFEPVFKTTSFYFGRRMHHKVIVADNQIAMVGGINISNHYNDFQGKPAWLDFALLTEGAIVKELCALCWKTWNGNKQTTVLEQCNPSGLHGLEPTKDSFGLVDVRMRRNDWVRRKSQISKTYIEMMLGAHSHITILCSYFLPGNIMQKTIKRAVKRGVKIKVIMAGKSDLVVAKNAERFMYDWLLRNKVEIYEYEDNILHGKIAVCDSKWMTIGSYNVNDISAYASIELNLDVNNAIFAKHVEQTMDEIIANDCLAITREIHSHSKNILRQFFRWISYEFFRLSFNVFTFYFKQRS